jgi:hypothetical protein
MQPMSAYPGDDRDCASLYGRYFMSTYNICREMSIYVDIFALPFPTVCKAVWNSNRLSSSRQNMLMAIIK